MTDYTPIAQPRDDFSPCGMWGCGNHGVCKNNVCACEDGWMGANCHIPPFGQVPGHRGDAGCGNWGVFGTMTLGQSGYVPTCECAHGMKGDRCEVECTEDGDCGHGTCDTTVGRCVCSRRCYNDVDCPGSGTCNLDTLQCNSGWTGVKCTHALDASCSDDDDCGVSGGFGEGGSCVGDVCVCDPDYVGLRCERKLSSLQVPCNVSEDCAGRNDVCVIRASPGDRPCHPDCKTEFTGKACGLTGEACEEDYYCQVMCREGVCATPETPPEMSDVELGEKLEAILDQILTPEGIAQLVVEESIEELLSAAPVAAKLAAKGGRRMVAAAARRAALRSTRVAAQGAVTRAVATNAASMAIKSTATATTRAAISKAMAKMAASGSTVVGWLYFALQVVGLVLDIDDAAGFGAQVPQGGVDMYLKKMVVAINDLPELHDVGVQFPREYLPQDTLEWGAAVLGEVREDQRINLMLDYIDRLAINSNGERIVTTWEDPARRAATVDDIEESGVARNATLWTLAGKNAQVYAALSRWWWLLLVLTVTVALTVGLGVGLSARRGKVRPPR